MNIKTILISIVLVAGMAFQTIAQDKVAYANVELILAYMPETKAMQGQLVKMQKAEAQKLEATKTYMQTVYMEAQETASQENPDEAKLQGYQTKLEGLQKELQEKGAAAEQMLARKRAQLMAPITTKLQTAMEDVAKADGYSFILNSVDGTGFSIVLYGPDDRNLTKKIMQKLGIEIPEE